MQINKSFVALMIGNALEYYDAMLYGFFAVALTPLFFPSNDIVLTAILGMATFSITYLVRPLGGIIFGHLGDRIGRKKTLSTAIILMSIPTLLIAFLPTFEDIGYIAPIILMTCRILQGISLGGESSGAMTYVAENASLGKEGFASSIMVASCYLGALIGTGIGAFFMQPFMPAWAWRIPFALGAIVGLVGFYIRSKMNESQAFVKVVEKDRILDYPILKILKTDKIPLLRSMGLASVATLVLFLIVVQIGSSSYVRLELEASTIMLFSTLIMLLFACLLPFMGMLSDRIGKKKQMRIASLAIMLVAYPLYVWLESDLSVVKVLITQSILTIVSTAYVAPICAVTGGLFKANSRYTGIAFGYSLGAALSGGITPMLITYMTKGLGLTMAPAICFVLVGMIGLLVTVKKAEVTSAELVESIA